MRNFRLLEIWQFGLDICINCYRIIETFPKQEKWGLALQITRAAVSISSNIAEGCSRSSDKDYNRFIEIALGSSYELETQLLISQKLNIGEQGLIHNTLELLTREEKMLMAFSNCLKR